MIAKKRHGFRRANVTGFPCEQVAEVGTGLGNAKQAEFIAEAVAVAPSDDLASITTAADMLFDAVNKLLAECDDRESTPEIDAALDEVAECRNLYNDIRTKVLGPRRAGAED